MHFLKDLLENPESEDPVKTIPQVHRHFVRYSKGIFDGPGARIKITAKNINVYASFEFEDLLAWITAKSMQSSDDFKVTGTIIGGKDFSDPLKEIGLNWEVKKSTGKTQNYKCVLKTAVNINKEKLIRLIDSLNNQSYILLNFKAGAAGEYTMKTAKNPPRPKQANQKGDSKADDNKSDEDFTSKIKFTSIKIPFSEESRSLIIDEIVPDFKDEILSKSKQIDLNVQYDITSLILPPKEMMKKSTLFRYMTLREGELIRSCTIDGKSYKNQIKIKV